MAPLPCGGLPGLTLPTGGGGGGGGRGSGEQGGKGNRKRSSICDKTEHRAQSDKATLNNVSGTKKTMV